MDKEPDHRMVDEIHRAKLAVILVWIAFTLIATGLCYYAYGYMQPSFVRIVVSFVGVSISMFSAWEMYLVNFIENPQELKKVRLGDAPYPRARPREERTINKFLKWLLWDSFHGRNLTIFFNDKRFAALLLY